MKLKRRDFLKLSAAAGATVAEIDPFTIGCRRGTEGHSDSGHAPKLVPGGRVVGSYEP